MVVHCEMNINYSLMPRVKLLDNLHQELAIDCRSIHTSSFEYGGKPADHFVSRLYEWIGGIDGDDSAAQCYGLEIERSERRKDEGYLEVNVRARTHLKSRVGTRFWTDDADK